MELREQIASLCHEQWAGWMRCLSGRSPISTWGLSDWTVNRMTILMDLPYEDLDEKDKETDRKEADKYLALMEGWVEHKGISHPTWEIEIVSTGLYLSSAFRELDADFFQVYDDGRIIFYNGEKGYGAREQIAAYASGQWYGVRKIERKE